MPAFPEEVRVSRGEPGYALHGSGRLRDRRAREAWCLRCVRFCAVTRTRIRLCRLRCFNFCKGTWQGTSARPLASSWSREGRKARRAGVGAPSGEGLPDRVRTSGGTLQAQWAPGWRGARDGESCSAGAPLRPHACFALPANNSALLRRGSYHAAVSSSLAAAGSAARPTGAQAPPRPAVRGVGAGKRGWPESEPRSVSAPAHYLRVCGRDESPPRAHPLGPGASRRELREVGAGESAGSARHSLPAVRGLSPRRARGPWGTSVLRAWPSEQVFRTSRR